MAKTFSLHGFGGSWYLVVLHILTGEHFRVKSFTELRKGEFHPSKNTSTGHRILNGLVIIPIELGSCSSLYTIQVAGGFGVVFS